jgi:hypothetical protein
MSDSIHIRKTTRSVGRRARAIAGGACLLAGVALSGTHALAQGGPAAGSYVVVQDGAKQVPQLSLTVKQLDGMDIMYSTHQIGDVGKVLADASGNIVAVTVIHGGYFGYFQDEVVLPLDRLTAGSGYLNSSIDTKQLETLPVWKK